MFKAILMSIREANNAVRKGNEYRLKKYGPNESFAENFRKSRKICHDYKQNNVPNCLSMFSSNSEMHEVESYKMKFQYWDEWTGGRFNRRENPYIAMPANELSAKGIVLPDIQIGSICRSNPVTGYWEALND